MSSFTETELQIFIREEDYCDGFKNLIDLQIFILKFEKPTNNVRVEIAI